MASKTIIKALEDALALHAKGHALDHFNWGTAALTGNDIAELNELPGKLRAALKEARESQ